MMKLRSEDLTWREIEGEAILLDLRSSTYFRTNTTGTLLLQALVEGTTRDALVELLAADFELETTQAGHDVDAFVADMRARGLIDPGPS
jgi:hypothetical protein